jgi:para-aminobenzoate synthetase/4-amino-4-deoxychorismate lyase
LPLLSEVDSAEMWAAGYLSYEAARGCDASLPERKSADPLAWFCLFDEPTRHDALPEPEGEYIAEPWQTPANKQDYRDAIDEIKRYIAQGDTYQVNYTYPTGSHLHGSAYSYFHNLRRAQPCDYPAYLATGERTICSLSPELFFTLDGETIVTKPMKGTIARDTDPARDAANAETLRHCPKNRAENMMIVDMMRNDLGKIAQPGSVKPGPVFEIEPLSKVWQMTSTVQARTQAGMAEIIEAIFPCASITGAPKRRTMEIIQQLEPEPRGVYTGAIGFRTPSGRCQFSVAIRTVVVQPNGDMTYSQGGGIVWDSTTESEYVESQLKGRFLDSAKSNVQLLETMKLQQDGTVFLLDLHMDRLARSASKLGYSMDRQAIQNTIQAVSHEAQQRCPETGPEMILRLLLWSDGQFDLSTNPLIASTSESTQIELAKEPVDSMNLFLHHKTTGRSVYETACRSVADASEAILWNERGEVTESAIANIAVKRGDRWVTPPLSCGLLGGTYRQELLRRGELHAAVVMVEELRASDEIALINSVRLWRKASWF